MCVRLAGWPVAGMAGLLLALVPGPGAPPGGLTAEARKELEGNARELNNRAGELSRRGQYAEAAEVYREALRVWERLYPKDSHPHGHANLALTLNNLGVVLRKGGKPREAEAVYRQALAMQRKLFPKERYPDGHRDLVLTMNNLGNALMDLDGLAEGEALFRETVRACERLYPKERFPDGHRDLALSLASLGNALWRRGEYARAESFLRQTLAMYRRFYPKERFPQGHRNLSFSLASLGALLRDQGEYGKAEAFFREALAMDRQLYPAGQYPQGHPDLAVSLSGLAGMLRAKGEHAKAEPLYRESLEMRRRLYPKERYPRGHPQLAVALHNMGRVLGEQSEFARAEPLYREALQMQRRLYPPERHPQGHPSVATALSSLGGLLRERGEYAQSEPLLRQALEMRRRLYPKERYPHGHQELALSLTNLGFLLQAREEYAKAEPLLREVLAFNQWRLRSLADLAAEATAFNYATALPLSRDVYLSVTRRLDGAPDVYPLVWQGKAALARVLEKRHLDLVAARDPKARQLGQALRDARQRLARALLRTDPKEHARLTEEKEDLERRLAAQLRLTLPGRLESPPPEELARALPDGAAFVDLFRYTDFGQDPKVPGKKGVHHTPHYAAFVLCRGKPPARVELGEAGPIEEAWRGWRRAIEAGRDDREQAARLTRLAWAPLREQLPRGVSAVYLSADGRLGGVPWAALPGSRPGTVVLEECAVALVPHGPWLLRRLGEKPPAPAAGTLLAVGGVDYQAAPDRADTSPGAEVALRAGPPGGKRVVWKELPGTAREQQQVADLARAALKVEPVLRGGRAASTARLEADLPSARWAHLATHGFFADPSFQSAFQLDEEAFERLTERRETAGARSPLVLSGLVLAGANRQGDGAAPDRGVLVGESIVELRLEGMELAVLSACDTGLGELGDVAGGEGVLGLQRAFHLAGCKNVVASLWKVDDDATAAVMGLFYRNLWVEKLSPLEALRQAQLALYRNPGAVARLAGRRGADFAERDLPEVTARPAAKGKRAQTSLWAAFVLSGTGR